MDAAEMIKEKYRALAERLDEATLRVWAAVEARALGRGGVRAVSSAVGLSRTTIYAGRRELASTATRIAERRSTSRSRSGWRTEDLDGQRPNPVERPRCLGRADDTRGAAIAVALDLHEHPAAGEGIGGARAARQSAHGL